MKLDQADEEVSATRVMVFGTDSSWPEIGYVFRSHLVHDAWNTHAYGVCSFKYHPAALRSILFPQSSEDRPSKRRRLTAIADNAPSDTPPTDTGSDDELLTQRAVVVETLWESFLISQRGQIPSGEGGEGEPESDKENTSTSADGAARRYVIALLTNAGGTAGRLPRKPAASSAKAPESEGEGENKSVPEGDQRPHVNGAAQSGAAPGEDDNTNADAASKEGGSAPTTQPDAHAPVPASQREQSKASDESVDDGEEGDADGPIKILHRDLGEENFEFLTDGIHVLSSEVVNGMRKGWKLEAQQWKWVQVGVTS